MFSSKIRTSIITAIAALSVVSVGPFTSVASARKPVKVGHIEILCLLATASGAVAEFSEGAQVTATNPKTGETRTYKCISGQWVRIAQEAPPTPPTSQERVTGPLPVKLGTAG
ncbi:MAG: hypothetical protein ACLQMH_00030 [Solirubrobacteraceae bacterium]